MGSSMELHSTQQEAKLFRLATAGLVFGAMLLASQLVADTARAEGLNQAPARKIAVFDFELEDKSAGAGIIPQDSFDTRYLAEATEEAKRLLVEFGPFRRCRNEGC